MSPKSPLVSVIIRTCNRPAVLRNALISIHCQIYKNIETIVIEDGKNVSEAMLRTKFSDMNVVYRATGEKVGRTVAGNLGLSIAQGKYFIFLDDDDIFYPEHIATLVKGFDGNNVGAVYSIAEESQIQVLSEHPYRIKEKRKLIRYKQPYNKLMLFAFNYIPIQSILFKRELYEELGGFDEELDYLEDWDLWARFSTETDFRFIPKVTSKYYVPFRSDKKMNRNREMEFALKSIHEKFRKYQMTLNAYDVNREMDYIMNVYNKKTWYYYLKMIRNFILYKDM